ncbi:MAG: DUF192 domain-containing protein [Thermomicrobiaceae bacterium]
MGNVKVQNITRECLLGDRVREARSFWQRGRGLMFIAGLEPGQGLIIDPCSSIHSFWMRFPIDVLYMDRSGRVVRADQCMRHWRVGPVFTGSKWVIELPPGTIEASGTKAGDQIEVTT